LHYARLETSAEGKIKSLEYDDIYFQVGKGVEESRYVFLEKNNLPERFSTLEKDSFNIAELGFGSGLNFLLTAKLWDETAPPNARLNYISIEKHPIHPDDLARLHSEWPELHPYSQAVLEQYPPLIKGFHTVSLCHGRITLRLLWGDIGDMLQGLHGTFDAWYLDGFSPEKNPAMWDEKLYAQMAQKTVSGGTVATFSSAGIVRRGLESAGFTVAKTKGYGVKRVMTVAEFKTTEPFTSPAPRKTIAVLGAGIAGASAAYALAQKGYAVTVIDRHAGAAMETSGNPAGIIYPKLTLDESPMGLFHQHGFCYTRALLTALKLPSWNPCGLRQFDTEDADKLRNRRIFERGYYPDEFLRLEDGSIFQASSGYLSPPEFCRALLAHPNITTLYSTDIASLQEIKTDICVIALGSHSLNFDETAWLPLQFLRGQVTFLRETPESKKVNIVLNHTGYLTPAVKGTHVIGATFQREALAPSVIRPEDNLENLHSLNRVLPELGFDETMIAGARAGYRTTTPDKLPLIGRCPEYPSPDNFFENIFLSTAFGAHGMTGAPLAGEMIACLIAGDPLPLPRHLLAELSPERFIRRDLKIKRKRHGGNAPTHI
jgi:tRNA 5-methylaminomethyl-2-thiouridine biosynthesis bifunctional protein